MIGDAALCREGGVPMETESARGTAHVALGNSIAYGGTVDAIAHLDCVMQDATR